MTTAYAAHDGVERHGSPCHHVAELCVWEGDDGPGIRSAMASLELDYRAIGR